jgi:hypothetical protein
MPPAFARLALAAPLLLSLVFAAAPASAQDGQVLDRGMAVVTGFAGTKQFQPPAGNALDATFIDLDGASAEIIRLEPDEPPSGQLFSAAPVLQVKARDIGQVFAIGLDGVPSSASEPPSIYLGATSAFGLQIVLPDADGDGRPVRTKTGHPMAEWMPGQFGSEKGGGPGSIWKVDGKTGAVSLFATIPDNSGSGLGDIVFDPATRQFFASDLDTGLIHRLDASGVVLDAYDQTLVVENSADADWVEMLKIDLGMETSALAAVGMRGKNFIACWVWSREGVFAIDDAPAVAGTLVLDEVPAGEWRVEWWDTFAGKPAPATTLDHAGGTLRLPTPPVARHAAVVLEKED